MFSSDSYEEDHSIQHEVVTVEKPVVQVVASKKVLVFVRQEDVQLDILLGWRLMESQRSHLYMS